MNSCPSCSTENADTSQFCSQCGAALRPEFAATVMQGKVTEDSAPSTASDSVQHGRFLPGMKIADRYRIVSLVGKGGMGEVYRADDLKLGHAVALKFLPRDLADDPQRLEYFHSEVRLTRQISHPNVCRVYDVGEADGQPFLTMEYIDGEDLQSLLRRIGRLPQDKGIEIAQQLCAGVAAAHERGVLHRDLKPANVMIDGRGQARITDFGLARLMEDGAANEVAGTPAYMAPEQLSRGESTIQSDLYSLGLILFELTTGKPVVQSGSPAEILRQHQDGSVSRPSLIVEDVDPALERAILRCLELEPHERPKSAHAVAAALPGGDPLAAALAAGETPSPELVAAAGGSGAIPQRIGIACLSIVLLGLLGYVPLAGRLSPTVDLKDGPDFLAADAQDILEELGHYDSERRPIHVVYGFRGSSPAEFWYRQSPVVLTPQKLVLTGLPTPNVVTLDDPPLDVQGMISMRLDSSGSLLELVVVPEVEPSDEQTTRPSEWNGLPQPQLDAAFRRAGLRLADFGEPRRSHFNPPFHVDAGWGFVSSNTADDNTVRVDVGTIGERITWFHVSEQTTEPLITTSRSTQAVSPQLLSWTTVALIIFLAAIFLAWSNASRGRCDWQGAWRLGLVVFLLGLAAALLELDHQLLQPQQEASMLWTAIVVASSRGVRWWVYYLALEPFARRLWPHILTSWSRGMSGRFGDPRLGRDLLLGATVAVGVSLLTVCVCLVATRWLNAANVVPPGSGGLQTLTGTRYLFGDMAVCLEIGVSGIYWAFWMVLLRYLLRLEWLAIVVFVGIIALTIGDPAVPLSYVVNLLHFAAIAIVLTRFGVVAVGSFLFCTFVLRRFPMTADLSGPDVATSLFAVAVIAAWAGYGFYTSAHRRPTTGRLSA